MRTVRPTETGCMHTWLRRFAAAVAAVAVFAAGIPLSAAVASGAAVSKSGERHRDDARAEDSAKDAEEDAAAAEDVSAGDLTVDATATDNLASLLEAAAFFRAASPRDTSAIALIDPAHVRGPPA
jgi:hypothetical protein